MNPLVASVIRTIVPAAVGQVAAWLALLNVPLTPAAEVGLTSFLGFAFTAIYYLIVRVVEQQWPSFGILLGLPKSPDTYSKSVDTAAVPPAPTKVAPVPTVNIFSQTPAVDSAGAAPAALVSFADTQAKIDAAPDVSAPDAGGSVATAPVVSAPEVTAPDVAPAPAPAQ